MRKDNLPPLGEIIRHFRLSARKHLGQHYLLDSNLNRKIARAIAPRDHMLMEIGSGPGGLTRALLAEGAQHISAIEYDRRFDAALEELARHHQGRLTLIKQDARAVDPQAIHPRKIVGNLPFNIATPLLAGWLMAERLCFDEIIVLVQKEVAERIVARHASRLYGRLALLCQWRSQAEILFTVSARAFTPPPKVDAALVRITLAPQADDPTPRSIELIGRLAFQKRRKMLRASLKDLGALLEKAQIDSRLRAEQLSIAQFRQLAKIYEKL